MSAEAMRNVAGQRPDAPRSGTILGADGRVFRRAVPAVEPRLSAGTVGFCGGAVPHLSSEALPTTSGLISQLLRSHNRLTRANVRLSSGLSGTFT